MNEKAYLTIKIVKTNNQVKPINNNNNCIIWYQWDFNTCISIPIWFNAFIDILLGVNTKVYLAIYQ